MPTSLNEIETAFMDFGWSVENLKHLYQQYVEHNKYGKDTTIYKEPFTQALKIAQAQKANIEHLITAYLRETKNGSGSKESKKNKINRLDNFLADEKYEWRIKQLSSLLPKVNNVLLDIDRKILEFEKLDAIEDAIQKAKASAGPSFFANNNKVSKHPTTLSTEEDTPKQKRR